MPKGNAPDPYGRGGNDWSGPGDDLNCDGSHRNTGYGLDPRYSRSSIDAKNNAKRWDKESKYSDEQTKLDRPTIASDKQAKASSSEETYPWNSTIYGTPAGRQR